MSVFSPREVTGRWGNQVMSYLTVRELASRHSADWAFDPQWSGFSLFETSASAPASEQVTFEEACKGRAGVIKGPLLGAEYVSSYHEHPSKYLLPTAVIQQIKTIGVHFRGADFSQWNPAAILPFEYYSRALRTADPTEKMPVFVSTDDAAHPALAKFISYLDKTSRSWGLAHPGRTSAEQSYKTLMRCSSVVCSPSTFCLTAAILSHAHTIHSHDWVTDRAAAGDGFWVAIEKNRDIGFGSITLA